MKKNAFLWSKVMSNWIYIKESDVMVGRMQIGNNWGGSMVADPNTVWLGLEYFAIRQTASGSYSMKT